MTILIIGANGQLGSEIQKILSLGYSELGGLPLYYKDCMVLSVDVDELDITDSNAVDQFFLKHKIDLVFNCAAITNVDGCETNENLAYNVNALGAKNLAIACERYASRLIHLSTDYVFSGESKAPYVETDIPSPKTAYGRTKLAGEIFVTEHCHNSLICRTAWLYGYEGNNFVKTMLRLGKEKDVIKVVNDQVGNPTSAVDVAYQLLLLASSKEIGIFHCTCNGEAVSWYTFTKNIMVTAGIDISIIPCTTEEFPRPAKRPAYSALTNKRLRETIGDSMRKWEVALDSFLNTYLHMEEGK